MTMGVFVDFIASYAKEYQNQFLVRDRALWFELLQDGLSTRLCKGCERLRDIGGSLGGKST